MSKNILNEELNQMKYLFGYKPGQVISEQTPPKTEVAPTYKLSGITADNIKKFVEVTEEFLQKLGILYDVSNEDKMKFRQEHKTNPERAQYQYDQKQAIKDWWNEAETLLMNRLLTAAALYGWEPDAISTLNKDSFLKELTTYKTSLPYQLIPGTQTKVTPAKDWGEIIDGIGEDVVKESLKKAIQMKLQELGIKQ